MATERRNASCTAGAQEFGKSTVPNRSGAWACARPVAGARAASTRPSITSRVHGCFFIVVSFARGARSIVRFILSQLEAPRTCRAARGSGALRHAVEELHRPRLQRILGAHDEEPIALDQLLQNR